MTKGRFPGPIHETTGLSSPWPLRLSRGKVSQVPEGNGLYMGQIEPGCNGAADRLEICRRQDRDDVLPPRDLVAV